MFLKHAVAKIYYIPQGQQKKLYAGIVVIYCMEIQLFI